MALAGTAVSGCGKEKVSPGLMLSFSSDMSVPKDVSAVGLYIRTKTGTVIYNNVVEATVDSSGNRTVRFPSTFAVLSNGSAASVRVQLVAYGKLSATGRKAIVLRESTTGVPTDRLSLLRMPLLWLNQGSIVSSSTTTPTQSLSSSQSVGTLSGFVQLKADEAASGIPAEGFKSPCTGETQAFIGGKCREIDPNAPLPEFSELDKPGGAGATCFSVEKCFETPRSLVGLIQPDGSIDLKTSGLTRINLALITKDEIGIKLPDGRFAISLDSDSELEGFTVSNNRIVLSEVVRDALKSGRATDLIATGVCAQKTPDVGNCGDWNPGAQVIAPSGGDVLVDAGISPQPDAGGDGGGEPVDGGKEAGPPLDGGPPDAGDVVMKGEPQGPPEPNLTGLALAASQPTFIYSVREGTGNFDTSLRQFIKGDMNTTNGVGLYPAGGGYRLTYVDYGVSANNIWSTKKFIFATNAGPIQKKYFVTEVGMNTAIEHTLSGTFAPAGVVALYPDPLVLGTHGGGTAGYTHQTFNTYMAAGFTFPAPIAQEQPTAMLATGQKAFLLASNKGRVFDCDATNIGNINCGAATIGQAQAGGIVIDLAADGTDIYALVVRETGGEMGYEGIYRIFGGALVPLTTKATEPRLHFEPASLNWRNRIAVTPNKLYFSTAESNGTPSRIWSFPRQGGQPKIEVEGLVRALDVVADSKHVYYVDNGSPMPNNNDSRVYRALIK